MAEDDPVNIRRREFEVLRGEVADMKAWLTQDELSDVNKIALLKRVCTAMGMDPVEIFQ